MAYPALAIASAFAFGLLVGSFLNVVILRLPARLQFAWERDSREVLGMHPTADAPPPGIVVEPSHCPGRREAAKTSFSSPASMAETPSSHRSMVR